MAKLYPIIDEEIGARSPGWYRIWCPFCLDWTTTGHEPVCEDAWHQHAFDRHPRRYRRWLMQ